MVLLTIYIMGLIVLLHVFMIYSMRLVKHRKTIFNETDCYVFAVIASILWPIVIIFYIIYMISLLLMKWFDYVYDIIYKEENGTNSP